MRPNQSPFQNLLRQMVPLYFRRLIFLCLRSAMFLLSLFGWIGQIQSVTKS